MPGRSRTTRPRRVARPPVTPLRIPRRAPGILVVGGSFDPPHRWHVRVASAVRRRIFGPGGWIVFVPAARSPFKVRGPVAPPAERVRMLRLAIRRLRNAAVWTDEIDRAQQGAGGPSYMVDTLARLRTIVGDRARLRLLMGADQLVRFHEWKDSVGVARTAPPAVVLRRPISSRAALRRRTPRSAWAEETGDVARLVVDAPMDPMSSTRVRRLLARRSATRGGPAVLRRLLDPAVLAYIRRRGLYSGAGGGTSTSPD